jgi:hypothetical protein
VVCGLWRGIRRVFAVRRNVLEGADWRGARQNRLLTLSQGVGRRVLACEGGRKGVRGTEECEGVL